MLPRFLLVALIALPLVARAGDGPVRLHAAAPLVESGLLDHILPRFSLKTQVPVSRVDALRDADLALGDTGRAIFEGAGQVWRMDLRRPGHSGTERLADWLQSEIGQYTITSYPPGDEPLFSLPEVAEAEAPDVAFSGDARQGHAVSRAQCSRCHAVDAETRGWGIGSTPSFAVLRSMADWEARFAAFYARNPHPAFTQIAGLTEPFPPERPPPIAPVELSPEELEALLAYVAGMAPADLGEPLQHQ